MPMRLAACNRIGCARHVLVCHCLECQRRTGTVFSAGAYFQKDRVQIEGDSKLYIRDGQEGRKFRIRFCPQCGTSVYWDGDFRLDLYGIAVGAFADPAFPSPTISVFERSKHPWVNLPEIANARP